MNFRNKNFRLEAEFKAIEIANPTTRIGNKCPVPLRSALPSFEGSPVALAKGETLIHHLLPEVPVLL